MEEKYRGDHHNEIRNLCNCEKKAWKKFSLAGTRTLTSAILVHSSN